MATKTLVANKPTTLGGVIISQLIVFLFCVVFPGITTAMAPVSWVKFQRNGERVTAQAQVCMYFVLPYKTMTIDPVTGIGSRTSADKVRQERRNGKRAEVHTEGEGILVIQGRDQTAEVSVTPFNLKSVSEKAQAFLDDPQATELKLFVVANWKFSVLMGGVLSLLTALYVVCIALWVPVTIYKGSRRLQIRSRGRRAHVSARSRIVGAGYSYD